MATVVGLLAQLQVHPVLRYLTLDGITTFVRLITHLKRDIIQPQPVDESNPTTAPTVLPEPLTLFIGNALGIPADTMDDFWSILKDYAWEMPTVPLMQDDYDLFKQWGWRCGLTAVSIYPPDDGCPNLSCDNQIPLKKEYRKKAVVYTRSAGVQPAWNTSLYCPSKYHLYNNKPKAP
ncbi:hypothetical protein M413DRAFT_77411 [Hebeloma cylindrosporum]|uniref:CxC5 like cysteine cluster associated with KDZ domain-containing protein n=1 Tax=Hebeloma cylindrosporum TaxID=76867 RepID=A0A0C2XGZ4_HEBCY|nr:hypothetical protein M413DRAFT_77411 [Hebeloma cylindrosporum h7]